MRRNSQIEAERRYADSLQQEIAAAEQAELERQRAIRRKNMNHRRELEAQMKQRAQEGAVGSRSSSSFRH